MVGKPILSLVPPPGSSSTICTIRELLLLFLWGPDPCICLRAWNIPRHGPHFICWRVWPWKLNTKQNAVHPAWNAGFWFSIHQGSTWWKWLKHKLTEEHSDFRLLCQGGPPGSASAGARGTKEQGLGGEAWRLERPSELSGLWYFIPYVFIYVYTYGWLLDIWQPNSFTEHFEEIKSGF